MVRSAGILKALVVSALLGALIGCDNNEGFRVAGESEVFVQDYNPEYLDVLWVVDDRSPMFYVRDHLVQEAKNFFARLDSIPSQYRMGVISADTLFSPGQLKPTGNPTILTKNLGTLDQRALNFSNIIYEVINLHTGAYSNGFAAALAALTNGQFPTQSSVPLVMVFISDSDEHSSPTGVGDAVSYYASEFRKLKGNNSDLIRVYSVNYLPLISGQTVNTTNRCATLYNADIDKPGFQDRYFRMAGEFGGDTADLCGSFAQMIDLTGLALKELPRIFYLKGNPEPSTISVSVTRDGEPVATSPYQYDAASNSIVFDAAPPQGTSILVTYEAKR